MRQLSLKFWGYRYAPLPTSSRPKRIWELTASPVAILVLLTCLVLVAAMSFLAGKQWAPCTSQNNLDRTFESKSIGDPILVNRLICTVPYTPLVFRYNRTFGERPSDESHKAWKDLFPEQGGYFRHPTLAPQRSAFSVFHQLHCLVKSTAVSPTRTLANCV